jgi:hypothetical protein
VTDTAGHEIDVKAALEAPRQVAAADDEDADDEDADDEDADDADAEGAYDVEDADEDA